MSRELKAQLSEGSPQAWSDLVLRHYSRLHLYCGRFVHDVGDARDLVHDVFIKARRNIDTYDDRYAMSTWLYTIARNTGLDYIRKRQRIANFTETSLSASAVGTMICTTASLAASPRSACGTKDLYKTIFSAMDNLSNEHAEVLMLRYVEDMSRKEIADFLAIPENTVKSRLVNALQKLREYLPREIYKNENTGFLPEKK